MSTETPTTTSNECIASIIVPVFNDPNGVARCLDAIAAQSFPLKNIEVIVTDNGSIPALVLEDSYPFHVHVVRHLRHGSYAARNAGVTTSKGTFLAFIDADCWPDRYWLSQGIEALTASVDSRVIGGDVLIAPPEVRSAVALYQQATGFGQESNVRDKGFSVTANLFCTRQDFERIGPFDTRLLSGGDLEWCWRARAHGIHIHFEPRSVVHTFPRTSLRAAIRQARRVAGGRKMLRNLGFSNIEGKAMRRRRSPWQATIWILGNRGFPIADRVRILFVAILMNLAEAIESIRLSMGFSAERR